MKSNATLPGSQTWRVRRGPAKMTGVRLRGYQVAAHDEVVAHFEAGAKAVALVLPTGAGKTQICKCIAAGWLHRGPDRKVLIFTPMRAGVRQFQEPGPYLFNGREVLPWRSECNPRVGIHEATPAELVDREWLVGVPGVSVATRQALGRKLALDTLAAALEGDPEILRDLLVIADEAHHHHPKSEAGRLLAELRKRGATVLFVTATPYYKGGDLFAGDDVRVVLRTSPWFAMQRDEQGRPYCPGEWDFTRHFVGESSDIADAYAPETGGYASKPARIREACRAIAAKWLEDERPKAIFFLPERTWVAPMQRALAEAGADLARVRDFTGEDLDDDALDALERERKVKRYADSEIDAILSCARFDEATDWPLCAVGYCWRIPDSIVRNLQRLGRTARGKHGIEGYPARWRDVQTMRFFVRRLKGEGAEKAWKKHGELALVLGLFLADYREALQVARVVGSARDDDRAPRPAMDPMMRAQVKAHAMRLAARPGATAGFVIDGLRREFPDLVTTQAKAAALSVLRGRGDDGAELEKRRRAVEQAVQAEAAGSSRGAGWVRAELDERFAAIMDDLLHLPVDVDDDALRDIGLRFSAEDAEVFVRRFREAGTVAGYPWPETREGLVAFAQEHGRRHKEKHGKWPWQGEIEGHPGATWPSLNGILTYRYALSLREVFDSPSKDAKSDGNAKAIRVFFRDHGRYPSKSSRDEHERRLGSALGNLRRNRADLCTKYGIAASSDRGSRWESNAARVREWIETNGRLPRRDASDSVESRLARQLSSIRQNRPGLCTGIPHPDRGTSLRTRQAREQIDASDVLVRLCQQPHGSQLTPALGGDSGAALNSALRCAGSQATRSKSRGIGASREAIVLLCQATSLARLKAERDADCWRLWLDGAHRPDPRPWADILAAGDNKCVVKAARVAFLDWAKPGRDGKPARRPWPQAEHPDLLAPTRAKTTKTSRPKAGNRAE